MEKLLFTARFICIIIFISCNSEGNHVKGKVGDTEMIVLKPDMPKNTGLARDTSRKEVNSDGIRGEVLGVWAFVGDENATFIIDKKKITYPDQNVSYKYSLANDSLRIKFDGYDGNYLVKMRGDDTLILVGDEEQVYYRFKK